ncbi:PREPHENATE DEHYDRATASE P PROTEIN [Salix purpurea]|uniref:Arogenate dehydratase n=1 Tax=Salix purpurea TaxID=77065 RepID=A0A9Q0W600_SALPP|nr:PREPHENATE DEHYDRATASE P PROTEIN [Salix purpurea]
MMFMWKSAFRAAASSAFQLQQQQMEMGIFPFLPHFPCFLFLKHHHFLTSTSTKKPSLPKNNGGFVSNNSTDINIDDAIASFYRMVRMNPRPSVVEFGKFFGSFAKKKQYSTVVSLCNQMDLLGVTHNVYSLTGVRGAYSESAAQKVYPNCEAVPCEQFDTAFETVEKWLVDRAVLPIENSLGGSIHRNYDLLLRHRLHIVGEVKYAVRHCLLANHGVKVEDLKRVLSHPQALAQCENTLTKLGLVREAVDDTAGAAKHVALQKLEDTGAVASSAAASIYGLNILAEDIQDDSDNVTRFLILAREPIIPGTDRPFKTSIVFSLEEGPGVLFKALAVFALRQINLTKIESRPLRKQPLRASDDGNSGLPKYFDYLFYVDFEASMADENAQNACRHLKEFATFLRVLGSYPVHTSMM